MQNVICHRYRSEKEHKTQWSFFYMFVSNARVLHLHITLLCRKRSIWMSGFDHHRWPLAIKWIETMCHTKDGHEAIKFRRFNLEFASNLCYWTKIHKIRRLLDFEMNLMPELDGVKCHICAWHSWIGTRHSSAGFLCHFKHVYVLFERLSDSRGGGDGTV